MKVSYIGEFVQDPPRFLSGKSSVNSPEQRILDLNFSLYRRIPPRSGNLVSSRLYRSFLSRQGNNNLTRNC